MTTTAHEARLEVTNLSVEYRRAGRRAAPVRVIDDVSFALSEKETLALVGESGSGKTTIGNAILGLAPVTSGSIMLDGREISHMKARQRRSLAASLQVIFQDPFGSLNPALTVGQILAEPLFVGGSSSREEARLLVSDLLQRVGMPADAINRYPANFSGGQRQRIAIARAVARKPRVIVCDEPTSALDVTTQDSVLTLLKELQGDLGVAYLFITHDLAVVREFADRVIVLKGGTIVETGLAAEVCANPRHEYTQRLVASAPVPDPILQAKRRAANSHLIRTAVTR